MKSEVSAISTTVLTRSGPAFAREVTTMFVFREEPEAAGDLRALKVLAGEDPHSG